MSPLFDFHKLNTDGQTKVRHIAMFFDSTLTGVVAEAGPDADPRCMAIVRSKLEEACFYAKKAVALQPALREPQP